jgi:hypothetical protein
MVDSLIKFLNNFFSENFSILSALIFVLVICPIILKIINEIGISGNKFKLQNSEIEIFFLTRPVASVPYEKILRVKKQLYGYFFIKFLFLYSFSDGKIQIFDTTYYYVLKIETQEKDYYFSPPKFDKFYVDLKEKLGHLSKT